MRQEWDKKEWETLIERVNVSLFSDQGHVTRSEFSPTAIMLMLGAMQVSYYKYGPVKEGFPHKLNAIGKLAENPQIGLHNLGSLGKRLEYYFYGKKSIEGDVLIEPGNVEYLVDAMNFLMIEFMYPAHPKAHYKATDRDGSPGRVAHHDMYEGKGMQYSNKDIER